MSWRFSRTACAGRLAEPVTSRTASPGSPGSGGFSCCPALPSVYHWYTLKDMSTTTAHSLKALSDDELAARYAAAGTDEDIAVILAELERRDRKARRTATDKARWAAVYEEWAMFAHAQYLAAEEECRGNLVAREYAAEIASGWDLWTGSHRWATERATEELRDFWAVNTRITISEFREMQRASAREERDRMEAK